MPKSSVMDEYSEIYKRQKELHPDPQAIPSTLPVVPNVDDVQSLPLKQNPETLRLNAANVKNILVYRKGKFYRSGPSFDGYFYEIDVAKIP